MNARYLIIGAAAALALLVGALVFARTVERPTDVAADTPALATQERPAASRAAVDQDEAIPGEDTPGSAAGNEGAVAGAREGAAPARAPLSEPGTRPPEASAGASVTDPSESVADASKSGEDPSKEAILRATSRAYEGLRAFRADFEQALENRLLGRTTHSAGTLYQRDPDRFLMAFSDPEGDVIVSDGEWFWMYYPSVDPKQVLRTPRGSQGLDLKSQFIGDPVARFESTYHGTDTVRGREAHVLTLVPRESLGYASLKVWIDSGDHLVRRFELAEDTGNVRHFELRDFTVNPSLPDSLFAFTPPAGAQVVTR
ncbi:MAG: outer-membrane lipoprotein carrier protein LolA [Gemmatimonadota bacterium]